MSAAVPSPMPVRWSLVVAALLSVVAMVWMRRDMPDMEARSAPYVHAGGKGQRVVARGFAVEVRTTSPKLARSYLLPAAGGGASPLRLETAGIWVSALMTVEALERPGVIGAQLRARDGRIFPAAGADRPALSDGINLSGTQLSPGLPRLGAYFFELPPDALAGAHLQLFWNPHAPQPWDSLVDIDLGLDAAAARRRVEQAPAELDLRT